MARKVQIVGIAPGQALEIPEVREAVASSTAVRQEGDWLAFETRTGNVFVSSSGVMVVEAEDSGLVTAGSLPPGAMQNGGR
jgi:hypothetical protein